MKKAIQYGSYLFIYSMEFEYNLATMKTEMIKEIYLHLHVDR